MNEAPEHTYPDLLRIESEIEEILSDESISSEKAEFYKTLKTVINLKIGVEELNYKFEQFHEVFTAVAIGDFGQRIDIPNRKNLFTYMATAVNAVVEELEVNVVKQQYLEASLEYIPHSAIVTDKEGTILFANSLALKTLNKPKEDIIRLRIANIFESKTQFGIPGANLDSSEDIKAKIFFFDVSQEVSLTIKEVKDKLGRLDGFLYIAKLK